MMLNQVLNYINQSNYLNKDKIFVCVKIWSTKLYPQYLIFLDYKRAFIFVYIMYVRCFLFLFYYYYVLLAVIWRIMFHSAQTNTEDIYFNFLGSYFHIFFLIKIRERGGREVSFYTYFLTKGIC